MFNVLIFLIVPICSIFSVFRFKNTVYNSIKSGNQSPNHQQFENLPVCKIFFGGNGLGIYRFVKSFLDDSQSEISKQWTRTVWDVSNYLSLN